MTTIVPDTTTHTPDPLALEQWDGGYSGPVELSVRPPIVESGAPAVILVEPESGFLMLTSDEAVTLACRLLKLATVAEAGRTVAPNG